VNIAVSIVLNLENLRSALNEYPVMDKKIERSSFWFKWNLRENKQRKVVQS